MACSFSGVTMNSVSSLFNYPFSARSVEEKIQVKVLGRPIPDLIINQRAKGGKNSVYNRQFHRNVYENSWVCGCEVRNALFCFPCILFDNIDTPSWSITGVTDLGHLREFIKKHETNITHMQNVLRLAAIGQTSAVEQLSRAYIKQKRNQHEVKDRGVISKIIDCITFCEAFEFVVRDHGNLGEMVDLQASVEDAVRKFLIANGMHGEITRRIHTEILDCMLEVYRETVMQEIEQGSFVAVMTELIIDVSHQSQLALFFRYEHKGAPSERFWGLFKPKWFSADSISECILNEVNSLFKQHPQKVIAQTFRGDGMSSGTTEKIEAKIKDMYPNAQFIHCYAHQLNPLMKRAALQNRPARFFRQISEFATYFSKSPQRLSALEFLVARTNPKCSLTTGDFRSRTISLISENKESLKQCLLELKDDTLKKAAILRSCLENDEFQFWLIFFNKIEPHVDILEKQLRGRPTDSVYAKTAVSQFIRVINQIRESTNDDSSEIESSNKKRITAEMQNAAREVCDTITEEVQHRFKSLIHLNAANLLNSVNFSDFSQKFPVSDLEATVRNYLILDKGKLRTELRVLYQMKDFRNTEGAVPLLHYLLTNNLQDPFTEVTKLLKILVTIPMMTSEPERIFFSLRKIKTFLRSTKSQDHLTALAMLSVEKQMVSRIEAFNSKVLDKFCCRKEGTLNFNLWRECEDPEEQQNIEGVMEMKLEVLEEGGDNRATPDFKHVMVKKRPASESEHPARKRRPTTDDEVLETRSFEVLPRDECSVYGEHIANEIRKLSHRAQNKVKHLINNIIYDAQMGMYDNPQASPRTSSQTSPTPPAYSTHLEDSFSNENAHMTDNNCTTVKQEELSD